MAATASTPEEGHVTLEQFQRMPEEDSFRVELSRGRLVREPRPGAEHGLIVGRLAWRPPGDAHVHREDEVLETVGSLKGFSLRVAEIFAPG